MEQTTRTFSPEEILDLWEAGRHQHELDRALTLLSAAYAGVSRDQLADLTIGERDARLLRLRELVIGQAVDGIADCPNCGERVEFRLDTTVFARPDTAIETAGDIELNGTHVQFRLPTSRDLAEVVTAPDEAEGLRLLLERCLIGASAPKEMPAKTIGAVSEAMAKADPQAEIVVSLGCPNCGKEWEVIFDVAHFFWNEIAAQAQRLLCDIDVLARAYGWTEREILGLPAQRRRIYLEMLAA